MVYQTIEEGKRLYIQAPTGTGKTLISLYPSIKSVGKGRGEKIFYLTAKTITRTVAKETMELYAPLANRLGLYSLKWELEDLSFRYLYPEEYFEIVNETYGNFKNINSKKA